MKYYFKITLALLLFSNVTFSQNSPANYLTDSLAYEPYLTQISLAEAQLQMGEIADAKSKLAATDLARRGWELGFSTRGRIVRPYFEQIKGQYPNNPAVISLPLSPKKTDSTNVRRN